MPDLWKNDPDQKTNHREDARRVTGVQQQLQQFIVNALKQTRAKGTTLYEWAYQYGGLGALARQDDPEIKRAYFQFRRALQSYMAGLDVTAVNQFKQQFGENPLDWNFVKLSSRRSKLCSKRAAVMEIPDLVALADMREHFSTELSSDLRDAERDHEDMVEGKALEAQPEYETERDTEPKFEEPGSIFKKATLDFRELGKQGMYPLDSKYFPKKGDTLDYYDLNGDKQYGTVTRVGQDSMNIRDNHTKKVINQKFYRVPALAQQPPVKKPTAAAAPGPWLVINEKTGDVAKECKNKAECTKAYNKMNAPYLSGEEGATQYGMKAKSYHESEKPKKGRVSKLLTKHALAQEGLRQHGDYGDDDTYAKQMNDENSKQADGDINDPDYGSKGSYDQKMNEENSVKTAEGVSPQAENILNDPQLDYIVECYGSDDEVLRKAIADHFGPTFSAAYPNVEDWNEVADEVVQAINHSGISKESVQSAPGGSSDPQTPTVDSTDVAMGVGNYDMGNLPDHR